MSRVNWEQLISYINNECTAEERQEVDSWLKENRANRILFESLKHRKAHLTRGLGKDVVEDRWQLFLKRIEQPEIAVPRSHNLWQRWTIAASILLCVCAGLFFLQLEKEKIFSVKEYVRSVPVGRNGRLVLPDSSIVYMAGGSTISYDNSFNKQSRHVSLKGYAFFEVVHNPKKTFSITTENNGVVSVWGTSFSINSSKGVSDRVEVATGKVSVRSQNKSFFLTRGQAVESSISAKAMNRYNVDALAAAALKDSQIRFRDQTIEAIAAMLSSRYGIEVSIRETALNGHRFSGEVNEATYSSVASGVAFALGIKYKIINNNHLIFY